MSRFSFHYAITLPLILEVDPEVGIHSHGNWHEAVIVKDDGDGRWLIHYKDSPDDWDELVTKIRLRSRDTH